MLIKKFLKRKRVKLLPLLDKATQAPSMFNLSKHDQFTWGSRRGSWWGYGGCGHRARGCWICVSCWTWYSRGRCGSWVCRWFITLCFTKPLDLKFNKYSIFNWFWLFFLIGTCFGVLTLWSYIHCKYIQFLIVSTFHCVLAIRFTSFAIYSPQWSILVLERHFWILANLFKSKFDGLKISIGI